MTDEALEAVRAFREEIPEPDLVTVLAAWERAKVRHDDHLASRRKRLLSSRVRVAMVAICVACVMAAAAGAVIEHYAGSSPGFTAGFSAFNALPPAEWPSTMPHVALERAAAYMGVSPSVFQSRLRLVRSDAPRDSQGTTTTNVYAYLAPDGAACMFLDREGGRCIDQADEPSFPGVLPEIFPDYGKEPPIFVALVADNVTHASLVSPQASPIGLQIANNAIVEPLDVLSGGYELNIEYSDGTKHSMPLP